MYAPKFTTIQPRDAGHFTKNHNCQPHGDAIGKERSCGWCRNTVFLCKLQYISENADLLVALTGKARGSPKVCRIQPLVNLNVCCSVWSKVVDQLWKLQYHPDSHAASMAEHWGVKNAWQNLVYQSGNNYSLASIQPRLNKMFKTQRMDCKPNACQTVD